MRSRIYYRTLSCFFCNLTSDEAKKCCSEFETSRPRDPCYDFVMLYIYIKSLSEINFLRLEDVITLLYPSISSFKLIVSIADFQCLFCLV